MSTSATVPPGAPSQARSRSIPYALPADALEGLLHLAAHVALTETAALFLQQAENCWVLATSGVTPDVAHTAALLLPDILEPECSEFLSLDASAAPELVGLVASALSSRPGFLMLHRFPVEGGKCHAILALAHSVARPQLAEETGVLLSEVVRQIALRIEARAEKKELEASRERRVQRDRFLESLCEENTIGQCLVDPQGLILSVNAGLARELPLPGSEAIGRRFEQVFAFESAFRDEGGGVEGRLGSEAVSQIPWDRVIDTVCVFRQPSGDLLRLRATAATLSLATGAPAWCVSLVRQGDMEVRGLSAAHRHQRVLIAEDHPVNQRVIQGMVEKLGLSADVVSNGLEAVHAACHETYAAILMDCQMPDMDGIEATRFIRANSDRIGRVPIVAVTAFGHEEDRLRCFDAGVDGFMVKPIRIEELAGILGQWTALTPEPELVSTPPTPVEPVDATRQDLETAISRLSADLDPALVREVVALFLEDTRNRIQEIRKLSATQDRAQLRGTAHKIKGSCGSLGARALMGECERLEELAQSGSRDQVEAAVERVAEQFRIVEPIFRAYLESTT